MDRLKQIDAFISVIQKGSLSAAARAEGVTPAVIGRRIDALEARLGVKLLLRTTRHISLTHEGTAFLEDCQRIVSDLAAAEDAVSVGSVKASGHLRISAPAGFGRRYVAPHVAQFVTVHPEVTVSLDLSDRLVDLVNEGIDCAVRIGSLADSSLVSMRLGEMRRLVVASPEYLARHGVPQSPRDLATHECLVLGQQRSWTLADAKGALVNIKTGGHLECNDGAVLRDWALAGLGLAWRSLWEVGDDLRTGRLVSVLDNFAAPPLGIYALYPQRRQLPLRLRLFIDFLREAYGRPNYWSTGG